MGYTHYWTLKKSANDPARFKEAVELFKELWANVQKTFVITAGWDDEKKKWVKKRVKKEDLLHGWDGTGVPTFKDDEICFNGDKTYGLDHETFRISLQDLTNPDAWCNRRDNGDVWDFCKTARKPYDLAVCLALLAFKDVFGDDFEYSSDGVTRESIQDKENIKYWKSIGWKTKVEDEWKRAYKVYDSF